MSPTTPVEPMPTATERRDRPLLGARSQVHRRSERASYEREVVYAILDRGLVAHVGFVHQGEPFVLPMAYARVGDALLLHGSTRARLLESMTGGARVCVTVTLLDGVVLARSAFHHSMNYRSVTVLGRAAPIERSEDKLRALEAFIEKMLPGRWAEVRPPSEQELKATAVVAIPIEEAAAKARTGGPVEDPADLEREVWAGVIPLALAAGIPEADGSGLPGAPASSVVERLRAALGHRPPGSIKTA